jgi:uncharacterized protein (DUF433 family)
MEMIGAGIYSIAQAARLIGADHRAIRRWVLGYEYKYHGERRRSQPLWHTQFSDEDLPDPVIGFYDLLELRLVNAFVQRGVTLQTIRATAEVAQSLFATDYPLSSKRFLTDGKRIFLEALERSGEVRLLDVPRQQFVFRDIIRPTLYAGIEYEDERARRWYPLGSDRKTIVLDPAVQFGAPVVEQAGIPTDTLYASYLAENRDRRAVARVFDIPARLVDAAVRYEAKLAA